jgi:hypothetical protein
MIRRILFFNLKEVNMAVYFCERCQCNHAVGKDYHKDISELDDYEMLFKDPIKAMYDENWTLYKTGLIIIAAILSAVLAGFYFFG